MGSTLVTGTTGGIGEQIALYILGQQNTKVIGVGRRAAPTSLSSNPNYQHVQGDLSQETTIAEIKKVVGSHLDGAVFNAGLLDSITKVANTDMAAFHRVFEINLFSVVNLTKALIPALRNSNGRAIYVSSDASTIAFQAWAAYNASKAALNQFVATLAAEEPQITAIAVAPGVVDTGMQDAIRGKHVNSGEMSEEEASSFESLKAEGKLVSSQESGALYGRLCLSASRDLSGKYFQNNDPVIQ